MQTSLPNILITGGHGQLATALALRVKQSRHLPFSFHFLSRDALDITDIKSIKTAIDHYQPAYIINTAAYTAVDKAEADQTAAHAINHLGVLQLAECCDKKNIPLIHLSTDYIFDGNSHLPYDEAAKVNPLSVYGKTKWLGEEAVRNTCKKHIILRVSGVFSAYGTNFLKTMVRLSKERDVLTVVDDQMICPTPAADIADTLLQLITTFEKTGTYHYCGTPQTTWYQFTQAILKQAHTYYQPSVKKIIPISTESFQALAKRPLYSALNCEKLADHYGIKQPSWEAGIAFSLETLLARKL